MSCRSQSVRSRRSLGQGETTMLKYPGHPHHHLGSWNTERARPSSLSLEQMSGTLPSPWTLTNGMKLPASQLRSVPAPDLTTWLHNYGQLCRHYSHTMGRLKSDKDDNYTYPWVFFDQTSQQKSQVLRPQARYNRENINLV